MKQLRLMGQGCHVGAVWVGTAGYADDLILLAPSRSAMKQMLRVCEEYAEECNLQFSTDPNPQKSKSKCLFMCGYMDPDYPAPLKLCGRDLPWVVHATHLGHELHQLCTMEFDANMKRGQFIDNSVKIQETFSFANPPELLQAVQTYAGHWYGAMLWDLYGVKAGQLYRSWNTSVKVAWDVPRATHTYLVDNLLSCGLLNVKQQLVSRFVNFFRSLLKSQSKEVKVVASIVARCARSTTGRNLMNIQVETNMDPWREEAWKIRQAVKFEEVPDREGWRVQYLAKLIRAKQEMETRCEPVEEIERLIGSLCTS